MSAPTVGALPTAPQLLCAFQGRRYEDRELLRSAHALAELHARRAELADVRLVAEIDCRRTELVDDIDEWIAHEVPAHRPDAALHTETLGAVVDRMAAAPLEMASECLDLWLLFVRTLLLEARGDEVAYSDFRDRYRAKATALGFQGHMQWAAAMP